MSVQVRERNGAWWCFAESHGRRKARKVGPGKEGKALAEALRKQWSALIALDKGDQIFAPKVEAAISTGKGPRLTDALNDWLDSREKSGDLRGGSAGAYRSALKTWIGPHVLPGGRLLGDLPVDQISREHLGALLGAIKAAGRSRSTLGHTHNALRGVFRDLVEHKVIASNPARDLNYFIGKVHKPKRVEIFSAAEVTTILAAAEGTRLFALAATAIGTGARYGELAALTRDDLDFKGRRVHITKSWSPKSRKVEATKTDAGRFVPLAAKLVEVLKSWCEVRAAEGWGARALLFPRCDGGPESHIHEKWSALLDRAKVPYRNFHVCRHTFASHALRAGIRPELVQKWLGHATLTMTLGIYGHFIPDAVGDALDAEKLGNLLK